MKKGLQWLLVLMVVGALLVIASELSNSILQHSPASYQNISNAKGTFLLNITITTNGTISGANNATNGSINATTNVTFMFSNLTDAYMYNTTIFNTSQNQTYYANTSFDLSVLADGVYNISVNITNSTGKSHQNVSALTNGYGYNVTIDNTPPNVTMNLSLLAAGNGFTIVNGSNFSASSGNRSINFTIYDTKPAQVGNGLYQANLFNISVVLAVFSNGTGEDFNLSSFYNSTNLTNTTSSIGNRSGVWIFNYNISSLSEGMQGVTLYVNDTHNNTRVVVFNFTVDKSAPTITLATSSVGSTSAKVTVTANESVDNCTYSSVAGAQGSLGSGGNLSVDSAGVLTVYSKTFSSLTAGTGYQIQVTCTDFVGYTTINSLSFATSAAATTSNGGSSGSGGSGGGVSTGTQGSFEKKVWTSINAGETASVALKNGVLGVTEVSFSVPATVYGAWVHVSKRDVLPVSLPAFSGKVYKNVEITKGPALAKAGAFTDATVKFKVEKVWLAENNLAKEAVALHHNEDGKWAELETTVGEDDGTYVHYSAKTPSFSYFVIGQKSGAVAAVPEAAPVVEAPAEEAVEEVPAGEPAVEKKGISKGLLVALLAAVVVVVAVVLYLRKKR